MGNVKAWWMDLQEQERGDWIRGQIGDDEADETTEGWDELGDEYDALQEAYYEAAEIEEEYQWHQQHKNSEFYDRFESEIQALRDILDGPVNLMHTETYYKMIYAHSVTLLESFLGDAIKSLVVTNEKFLTNAVSKIPELRDIKPTLEEILSQKKIVLTKTLKWFSKVSFHKFSKVVRIYSVVISMSIKVDLEKVSQVAAIRHDIVHRNGKTTEGDVIVMDRKSVIGAIDAVNDFAKEMQAYICEAKNA